MRYKEGKSEECWIKTLVNLAQIGTDAAEQRFQVLAALTRLRQLVCHPTLVEDDWKGSSAKLDLLLGLVEEPSRRTTGR